MKTVYAVGLGPGSSALLTPRAREVLAFCDTVAGYRTYLEQIPELLPGNGSLQAGCVRSWTGAVPLWKP